MCDLRGERKQTNRVQCLDTPALSDAAHAAPRHPAHRHTGADAAGDSDAQSQVQELEEATLLQAAGGLHDHLVPVQEDRQN